MLLGGSLIQVTLRGFFFSSRVLRHGRFLAFFFCFGANDYVPWNKAVSFRKSVHEFRACPWLHVHMDFFQAGSWTNDWSKAVHYVRGGTSSIPRAAKRIAGSM